MICQTIRYTDFRNLKSAVLTLQPGVNLLVGENAAGKTSALEGIYLFATGRSHRTQREKDFIRDGESVAGLQMEFHDGRRQQSMQLRYHQPLGGKSGNRVRRVCLRNGIPLPKLSEWIGCFHAVLFCPGHLAIVQAGPSERRSFLDSAISQIHPTYMANLQRYHGVLLQRNQLLGSYFTHRAEFEDTAPLWSEQLAGLAEQIAADRAEYVARLQEISAVFLREMSGGKEQLELCYKKALSKDEYFALLTGNTEREAAYGATLYGPHREDIEIRLNGKNAREFASQGQQRSIAIAMKLGEGELSRRENGAYPVYLLDDILSELDHRRQQFVLSGLQDRQVILTGCDEALRTLLPPSAGCFHVSNGEIRS